jgi:hypothetical protein
MPCADVDLAYVRHDERRRERLVQPLHVHGHDLYLAQLRRPAPVQRTSMGAQEFSYGC